VKEVKGVKEVKKVTPRAWAALLGKGASSIVAAGRVRSEFTSFTSFTSFASFTLK
jgi:hypothetical protein